MSVSPSSSTSFQAVLSELRSYGTTSGDMLRDIFPMIYSSRKRLLLADCVKAERYGWFLVIFSGLLPNSVLRLIDQTDVRFGSKADPRQMSAMGGKRTFRPREIGLGKPPDDEISKLMPSLTLPDT
jgi:hypothetical protein